MAVKGKPIWGWQFNVENGVPALPPVFNYQLDGELSFADWLPWLSYTDGAPGYVSPQMTFCGQPDLVGETPGHVPVVPLRLYYSWDGNPGTWKLVDSADYTLAALCSPVTIMPRWPYAVALTILDFTNIDPYLPAGPVAKLFLMLTDSDPTYLASRNIQPRIPGGVGPV